MMSATRAPFSGMAAVCGLALFLGFPGQASAQLSWSPVFATSEDSLILTFDATGGNGQLEGFTGDVYLYTGVITDQSTGPTDWKYVLPAGNNGWNTSFPQDLKATRTGPDTWSFTYGPSVREFFKVPAGERIRQIAVLFRGVENGQVGPVGRGTGGTDMYVDLERSGLVVQFLQPAVDPVICEALCGQRIVGTAASSESDAIFLELRENGRTVASVEDDTLVHSAQPAEFGTYRYELVARDGSGLRDSTSFTLIVSEPTQREARPDGLQDGITYHDDGTVSLSLFAPGKRKVQVIGEFNDWTPTNEFIMRKDSLNADSTWFWITLDGLPATGQVPFQYLVDGTVRIADPYTSLVLDPFDDAYIPSSVFPDLPPYPAGKTQFQVGVLDMDRRSYVWKTEEFRRPPKTELVIYELLVRDFLEVHSFATLTDTLDYLERLGVNAIELMPVNEFEGNDSWGYNTSFYFAVDKYYGPADALKAFIDEAHSRGIAVILDMVLNHSFGQSPLVRLYNEGDYGPPTDENPWYNPVARHDFNVGYDFNHESAATQYFVDRVTRFWLDEFRVDGFRFDLSKGFTQTNTLGDVAAWGRYDPGRVRLLKRMVDRMWEIDPGAYAIMEHFADYREEKILSDHGMLLWRNMNHAYAQATMGYASESDFSGLFHKKAGFPDPHLVGYMESHDEQWLMFKNVTYGNASGDYDVRDFRTALERQRLAGAFFFLWPGPKMIWQFGELGYGGAARECLKGGGEGDGECKPSDPGRTARKPIRWVYRDNPARYKIYRTWSALLDLRYAHPAFTSPDTDILYFLSADQKYMLIEHPDLTALVIGNFGVQDQTRNFAMSNFNSIDTWYDYFTGQQVTTSDGKLLFAQKPGDFAILTSAPFPTPDADLATSIGPDILPGSDLPRELRLRPAFPNPFNPSTTLTFEIPRSGAVTLQVVDVLGRTVATPVDNPNHPAGVHRVDLSAGGWGSGTYFAILTGPDGRRVQAMTLLK